MALSLAIAGFPHAYHRIEKVAGGKSGAIATVRVYADAAAAADPEAEAVHQHSFAFVPGGADRWDAQAYRVLKTLDPYEGCADA